MGDAERQQTGDEIEVRALLPGDAERLTACFERYYGTRYAHEVYVDPAVIRERLAQGRLHSAVAVTSDGEIVGHIGLILRRDGDISVDGGGTVVDVRYRNRGLVRLTAEPGGSDSRAAAGALVDAVGEATRCGIELMHLDVPLARPAALSLVAPARDLGFFFCGVLPEYRDGDVLRLQRLEPGVAESSVLSLHTDRARELLSFVRADRASVAAPVRDRRTDG